MAEGASELSNKRRFGSPLDKNIGFMKYIAGKSDCPGGDVRQSCEMWCSRLFPCQEVVGRVL